MKTTIDIPEDVLRAAMRNARAGTKKEAVLTALADFNRKHRQRRLIKYRSKSKTFMTRGELMKLRSMG